MASGLQAKPQTFVAICSHPWQNLLAGFFAGNSPPAPTSGWEGAYRPPPRTGRPRGGGSGAAAHPRPPAAGLRRAGGQRRAQGGRWGCDAAQGSARPSSPSRCDGKRRLGPAPPPSRAARARIVIAEELKKETWARNSLGQPGSAPPPRARPRGWRRVYPGRGPGRVVLVTAAPRAGERGGGRGQPRGVAGTSGRWWARGAGAGVRVVEALSPAGNRLPERVRRRCSTVCLSNHPFWPSLSTRNWGKPASFHRLMTFENVHDVSKCWKGINLGIGHMPWLVSEHERYHHWTWILLFICPLLLWGQAGRIRIVQPRGEKASGRPYCSL